MDLLTVQNELQAVAKTTLGIPYLLGGKYANLDALPAHLDCSGLVKYVFDKVREELSLGDLLQLPDGSENELHKAFQGAVTNDQAQVGDLAFFAHFGDPQKVYHVGMLYDPKYIIESRAFDGRDWTGKVLLRDRRAWEGFKDFGPNKDGFIGYYRHPDFTKFERS